MFGAKCRNGLRKDVAYIKEEIIEGQLSVKKRASSDFFWLKISGSKGQKSLEPTVVGEFEKLY